jgi:hypothetical protein
MTAHEAARPLSDGRVGVQIREDVVTEDTFIW